jgi:hypothetical protein
MPTYRCKIPPILKGIGIIILGYPQTLGVLQICLGKFCECMMLKVKLKREGFYKNKGVMR